MVKRFIAFIVTVLLVLSSAGCWSRREIEKLAMATMLTYDKVTVDGREKWMVSGTFIIPGALAAEGPLGGKGGETSDKATLLVSGVGNTVWEAARNLSTRLPRREYIAHTNIIIFSEKVAREGVDQIIDAFLRSKDIRLNTWVLVTKGQALDVLKTEPEMEQLLSQEIIGLVQNNQPTVSKAVTTDIKSFINQLITPGQDAVASYIEIFKRDEETGENKTQGSSTDDEPQKALRLIGASVFRKEKLAGFLDDLETKGFLYGIGKAKQGTISINVHEPDKNDVVFAMTRSSSKIIPKVDRDEITFIIEIFAEGDLQQHEDTKPIADPKTMKTIEERAAQEIKAMVEKALNKAQKEFEADIFGLGDRLHKRYPQIWKQVEKNWRDIYPDIEVTVKVDAKIRRTGLITDTPIIR